MTEEKNTDNIFGVNLFPLSKVGLFQYWTLYFPVNWNGLAYQTNWVNL
jgi:hypothetical protein